MDIKYNSIVINVPELQIYWGKGDSLKNQSSGRLSKYLQNIDEVIVHGLIDWPSSVVL